MFVASPTQTSLLAPSSALSVPSVLKKARCLTKTTLLFASIPTADRQSEPVDLRSLALFLDAASSISPLFATLTKNTGGWGYISFSAGLSERRSPRLGRGVSALGSPSSLTLSLFRAISEEINPLFSNSSTLFKKECLTNSLAINGFRTLLQNTWEWGHLSFSAGLSERRSPRPGRGASALSFSLLRPKPIHTRPSDCKLSALSCQPLLLHLSPPSKPGRPA